MIGLLVDQSGFPLGLHSFEGNTAETKTILPVVKSYALAGIKGYVTNLDIPNQQVIDSYHQLFQVEASFRMAKSDFKARPIFHRKRDSIDAHLTIVLTALAMGRNIEAQTGMSIKQFVKILRPVRAGGSDYQRSRVSSKRDYFGISPDHTSKTWLRSLI